jgi:hypothetical protein
MLPLEPAKHIVGIEPDALSIRAHEGSPEDPAGPAGEVIRFQAFQKRDRHFGALGDCPQRQPATLAFAPQVGAKSGRFVHQLGRISMWQGVSGVCAH